MDNRVDDYIHNLICYVQGEPNLWRTKSLFYENPQMQQISWESVTRKLKVLYKTEEITVDNVKRSWNNLLERYNECKRHRTAYIFPLILKLNFLEEYPENNIASVSLDGLFSRKYGRFLLLIQIVLNIGFFLLEIPLTHDILAIKPTTCFQFLHLLLPMFAFKVVLLYQVADPIVVDYEPLTKMLPLVATISPIVILIYYLLSFLECHNSIFDTCGFFMTSLYFIITQIITIFIHACKLERPPTTKEMSTVLTIQLSCALLMLVQLPNTPWKHFYLVTVGWAFSNFLILTLYYVICHCNAKTIYKFEKQSRLLAQASVEEPYVIRFESED